MKELLKLGGYLFVVCAVAGVALSGTNHLTEKRIKEGIEASKRQALKEVLPAASDFKDEKDYKIALDKDDKPVGYILNVLTTGYSGKIEAIVGIDLEGKIKGVKVLTQTETPGLGTKITTNACLDQFEGLKSQEVVLKKDGGRIDAVTAATISSRAITNAVRERINEFEKSHR